MADTIVYDTGRVDPTTRMSFQSCTFFEDKHSKNHNSAGCVTPYSILQSGLLSDCGQNPGVVIINIYILNMNIYHFLHHCSAHALLIALRIM